MAAETEVTSSAGHDLNTMRLQGDPITAEEADKHNGMLPSVIYRCRGHRGGGVLADAGRQLPASEVDLTDPHRQNSYVTNRLCHQMSTHTSVFCVWVQSEPHHITRVPITAQGAPLRRVVTT